LSATAGLHVPFIPLFDVRGRAGMLARAQIVSVGPKLNVGITTGLTVTLKVVVVAHWPASGVKEYVLEF